jgi:hypothetical protein
MPSPGVGEYCAPVARPDGLALRLGLSEELTIRTAESAACPKVTVKIAFQIRCTEVVTSKASPSPGTHARSKVTLYVQSRPSIGSTVSGVP